MAVRPYALGSGCVQCMYVCMYVLVSCVYDAYLHKCTSFMLLVKYIHTHTHTHMYQLYVASQVQTYIHTYTHTHTSCMSLVKYTHIHIYTYTHLLYVAGQISPCIAVCISKHVHRYIDVRVCLPAINNNAGANLYIVTCIYACMHVMYVCMYTHMYTNLTFVCLHAHACVHTYIYTRTHSQGTPKRRATRSL
jgi:hypothetical protein